MEFDTVAPFQSAEVRVRNASTGNADHLVQFGCGEDCIARSGALIVRAAGRSASSYAVAAAPPAFSAAAILEGRIRGLNKHSCPRHRGAHPVTFLAATGGAGSGVASLRDELRAAHLARAWLPRCLWSRYS
jgi:hypothetical protein